MKKNILQRNVKPAMVLGRYLEPLAAIAAEMAKRDPIGQVVRISFVRLTGDGREPDDERAFPSNL